MGKNPVTICIVIVSRGPEELAELNPHGRKHLGKINLLSPCKNSLVLPLPCPLQERETPARWEQEVARREEAPARRAGDSERISRHPQAAPRGQRSCCHGGSCPGAVIHPHITTVFSCFWEQTPAPHVSSSQREPGVCIGQGTVTDRVKVVFLDEG